MWWLPGEQGHTGRFPAGICWWSTLVQAGHFSWGPPHYHHPLLGIHIPPYIPEGPWASWLLATCGEWERDLYKISEHRCHHSCWMIDGHCAGSHLSVVLSGLQHEARPLPQLLEGLQELETHSANSRGSLWSLLCRLHTFQKGPPVLPSTSSPTHGFFMSILLFTPLQPSSFSPVYSEFKTQICHPSFLIFSALST